MDLSGTWRFRPEGGRETSIDVPGFWEAQGHLTLDGRATYERDVVLDEEPSHATLEFDAVADHCDVFVNDRQVGSHEVGFTPFVFDVSGQVRRGANTVRVEVFDPGLDSPEYLRTPQGKQGWGNRPFPSPPSVYITYGGIWQPCRLVTHGPAYIADVWCDMDPDHPTVGVEVRGSCDEVEVRAFGQTLRGPSGTFTFDGGAELWTPTEPNLHRVEVDAYSYGVRSHSRSITTGLRRIERSGDDVLLNGEPYRMRSALHQGFWPRGLYLADDELIERDVDLALAAGLNTLRTHLKAFEPDWLDAADRKGLIIQADLPIGEPLRDGELCADEDFVRRCVITASEQVRRDRSHPSVLFWTLTNEVGLMNRDVLGSSAYRELISKLTAAVTSLDSARPIVENDWVFKSADMVASDVRTAHWYGRTTNTFLQKIDEWLDKTSTGEGPFYVTEFGEWGLPDPESGDAFWDFDEGLIELVAASGWRGTHEELAARSQEVQGWAGRIQAERFRTAPHVKGFCLTEWTDVPHELNGLVSLRRNEKRATEMFRSALADVAPIAIPDRWAYVAGETVEARIFVSNWSKAPLEARELTVSLGGSTRAIDVRSIAAGGVTKAATATLTAEKGTLTLRYGDVTASYDIHVCEAPSPQRVRIVGAPDLEEALVEAGWRTDGGVTIAVGALPADGADILLEPTDLPHGWPVLEDIPTRWGPTPIPFTTTGMSALPDAAVLAREVFACYPRRVLANAHGPVGAVVPPPIGRWGALVAEHDGVVISTLSLREATIRGDRFALAVLADLVDLARIRTDSLSRRHP